MRLDACLCQRRSLARKDRRDGLRRVTGLPEADRSEDEGPVHRVKIEPFWMGKHEVTWDEYDVWSYNLDIQRRKLRKQAENERDKASAVVTRPTKPYTDMTFDMGHTGYPAICLTQLAAAHGGDDGV